MIRWLWLMESPSLPNEKSRLIERDFCFVASAGTREGRTRILPGQAKFILTEPTDHTDEPESFRFRRFALSSDFSVMTVVVLVAAMGGFAAMAAIAASLLQKPLFGVGNRQTV